MELLVQWSCHVRYRGSMYVFIYMYTFIYDITHNRAIRPCHAN